MKKVLITGVAGFVGSHLYQYLTKKGYEVSGIDNLQHPIKKWYKLCPKTIHWDITSLYKIVAEGRETLAFPFKEDFDVIIHLAATISVDYSLEEPWSSLYNNVVGTLNMLEFARLHDCKFIMASSCEIYGSNVHPEKPMDETHPINPASPYGFSKYIGELLCKAYHQTYGLKVNIMRPFNICGEGQRSNDYGGVIAKFVRRILGNHPPEIYGDGKQTRDYTYIGDIVRAYEIAIKEDFKGEPVNFGSGREVSINTLADILIDLCGKKGKIKPVHVAPRKNEVRRSWCDYSKAKSQFGWEPKVSFEEALRRIIRWFRRNDYQR